MNITPHFKINLNLSYNLKFNQWIIMRYLELQLYSFTDKQNCFNFLDLKT